MPTINYIYHGNQYLCETDESDTPTKLFVNEPGTYTNLVSQKDLTTGERSYPLYDALGSTRAVTDDNGDVTDTFVYDAWGNVLDRTGVTEIPFQYVGKHGYYRDEETEANYVMRRFYNPGTIRWMSLDRVMIGIDHNLYEYADNSPLEFYDPSGIANLSVKPIEATSSLCGFNLIKWEWKPEKASPGQFNVAAVQYVCMSGYREYCECDEKKLLEGKYECGPKENGFEKIRCCMYEYFSFTRLGGTFVDQHKTGLGGVASYGNCSSRGELKRHAIIRIFSGPGAISHIDTDVRTNWNPGGDNNPLECGAHNPSTSPRTQIKPYWWDGWEDAVGRKIEVVGEAESWSELEWDCCPGFSQSLTLRSSTYPFKRIPTGDPNIVPPDPPVEL